MKQLLCFLSGFLNFWIVAFVEATILPERALDMGTDQVVLRWDEDVQPEALETLSRPDEWYRQVVSTFEMLIR